MMKIINLLILFFVAQLSFSQIGTIKVKKNVSQSNMSTVVTCAGMYYGMCTKPMFLAAKTLELSNSINNLTILDFDISIYWVGRLYIYHCKGAGISKEVFDDVEKNNQLERVYI